MKDYYEYLLEQDARFERIQQALQKLADNGTYSYKALKAYIVIDASFENEIDRRKLKWAKRYLHRHDIKFNDIKESVEKLYQEDLQLDRDIQKAIFEVCPRLSLVSQLLGYM